MNVAHAIHGVGLGGAQKVITSVVRGRRDATFNYFVYCALGGIQEEPLEAAGATVRVLPRLVPRVDPLWAFRLARAMRCDGIDLIHAHLFGDSLHAFFAARACGLPLVLTLHGVPEGWNVFQRPVYPWLLAHCDRAIACSNSVQRAVAEVNAETAERMQTIGNGIEPPTIGDSTHASAALKRSLGVETDVVVVAGIGRLAAEKSFDTLISAYSQLESEFRDRSKLVLIGEGDLREALTHQAKSAGVADRVVFTGFRENVAQLLSVIDVVVFSSRHEGLPIALLEAMAAGRCVVATDIPGYLDALRPELDAVIASASDPGSLSRALSRVISDAPLRAQLGENAREQYLRQFTADTMVRKYESLYEEVIAARRR